MASTTSTLKAISSLKLPNPRSPSSSQTQRLLGFNLSQYPFSTQDLHQHFSTTRHSKSITIKASSPPIKRKRTSYSPEPKVQELYVYEMNDGNPGYLELSEKPVNSVGDLVPFGNKIYTGDLKKRLGITAGVLIKHVPEKSGHQYEAIYSFYFAEYGHVSVQGKYSSSKDMHLEVTGGSGIFQGVSGHVKLQLIVFPSKLFYTFHLEGIPDLPPELMGKHVIPTPSVEPSPAAKATQPRAIITKFTLSC